MRREPQVTESVRGGDGTQTRRGRAQGPAASDVPSAHDGPPRGGPVSSLLPSAGLAVPERGRAGPMLMSQQAVLAASSRGQTLLKCPPPPGVGGCPLGPLRQPSPIKAVGLGARPNSLRKGIWETKSVAGGLEGVPASEVPKLEPRCCYDCPPVWVHGWSSRPSFPLENVSRTTARCKWSCFCQWSRNCKFK